MARHGQRQASFVPYEAEARSAGYQTVVGLDEAGRGPLAGPVVAAAVLLSPESPIPGLQDSKRLTARQRDEVYGHIQRQALTYGIGIVSHKQIDRYNILWATQEAMRRAVRCLHHCPDMLLVDGNVALPLAVPQRLIVRGDSSCASIAAASVLAKVTRDRLMMVYSARYPLYGFDKHKGYPTRQHYACLQLHGPCAIHRLSFRGVMTDGATGEAPL